MKKKITILILILFVLILYIGYRAKIVKQIDNYSDSFFAEFSTNSNQIKKYINKNQNLEKVLSVVEKHQEAIVNFDYKNTKPHINLMLNKATADVSWHLTILFEKQKNNWHISEFKEYADN